MPKGEATQNIHWVTTSPLGLSSTQLIPIEIFTQPNIKCRGLWKQRLTNMGNKTHPKFRKSSLISDDKLNENTFVSWLAGTSFENCKKFPLKKTTQTFFVLIFTATYLEHEWTDSTSRKIRPNKHPTWNSLKCKGLITKLKIKKNANKIRFTPKYQPQTSSPETSITRSFRPGAPVNLVLQRHGVKVATSVIQGDRVGPYKPWGQKSAACSSGYLQGLSFNYSSSHNHGSVKNGSLQWCPFIWGSFPLPWLWETGCTHPNATTPLLFSLVLLCSIWMVKAILVGANWWIIILVTKNNMQKWCFIMCWWYLHDLYYHSRDPIIMGIIFISILFEMMLNEKQ